MPLFAMQLDPTGLNYATNAKINDERGVKICIYN